MAETRLAVKRKREREKERDLLLKDKKRKNNGIQNTSSFYVRNIKKEYLKSICKNATDYVNIKVKNKILYSLSRWCDPFLSEKLGHWFI